jgi:hypothetical protein
LSRQNSFPSGLADVGPAGTELEQAFELGVLIAVGGVDVDDRRLRTIS